MPIDPVDFKSALSQFASGVTVVTTRDAAGTPLGITVSAFCSISLEPPLVLVSIDNRSEVNQGLRAAQAFAVSILGQEQQEWSQRFAITGPAKFTGVALSTSRLGLVLVPGAVAHLECRVSAEYPGGDHTLYLGEVLSLAASPGPPLVYHARGYRSLAP